MTTKKQTVHAINALGLIGRWDSDWQEFTVNYRQSDPRRTAESRYHCTDPQDAVETAHAMATWQFPEA